MNADVHFRHQCNTVTPLCRDEETTSDAAFDSCVCSLFHFMPLSQLVSVPQLVCRGGGRVVVCVCDRQSLSVHDRGCAQATGQPHPKPEMSTLAFFPFSFSLTPDVRSRSAGVFRVRFSPPCAALDHRPVSVHRPEVAGLLRRAEGRRHSVPVPHLCTPGPHHPPAVPAGPGKRSPRLDRATGQQRHLPR